MTTELYRLLRPKDWPEVVGQQEAVAMLQDKLASNSLPHAVLLYGPTGTGKTTIARILAGKVGCDNPAEINCADDRGIDIVRDIDQMMRYNSLGGGGKVWILDEVVQLPKITQQAFLKILEEPPKHVWFFLCTSDMTGLLPSFKGRCFQIHLEALSRALMESVVVQAIKRLKIDMEAKVIDKIVELAEGNARAALVLLEAAITKTDPDEQMGVLSLSARDQDKPGEFLCKLLLKKSSWGEVVKSIQGVDDKDVEGYRRAVLKYACAVMPNRPEMAVRIINWFEDNMTWSGKAGLWKAAYNVWSGQ